MTIDQFVSWLSESGLWSATDLQLFQESFEKAQMQGEAEPLLEQLIERGKITPYQANRFRDGSGDSLILGNYVVLDQIGAGGMGEVYRAYHRRMDRIVALKLLSVSADKSRDAALRFSREVKTAAKLTHPNIVTAFDADEADGVVFLVMEHVAGSDLSKWVKENGPMQWEHARDCIIQAARGLEYAHRKGVIHRDIKPANLLLDPEGVVRILDMGLVGLDRDDKSGDTISELTDPGAVMGSFDYMAPEQAVSIRDADRRSDIYSLGCTFYFLLSGQPIHEGDTPLQRILAHREKPTPSVRRLIKDVPNSIDLAIRRMLAKSPNDRYQTLTEVISALEATRPKEPSPKPKGNTKLPRRGLVSSNRKIIQFISSDIGIGVVKSVYQADESDDEWTMIRYVVEVMLTEVELGESLNPGQLLYVRCWVRRWKSHESAPPHDAGQDLIPEPGGRVRTFLRQDNDGGFDALYPKGFELI